MCFEPDSLRKLERIRGNFTLDFISSLAWAAEAVCATAAFASRHLNGAELTSLSKAVDSMDRAHRVALAAAA